MEYLSDYKHENERNDKTHVMMFDLLLFLIQFYTETKEKLMKKKLEKKSLFFEYLSEFIIIFFQQKWMEVNPFQHNERNYHETNYPFAFPFGMHENDDFLHYYPENSLHICSKCQRKGRRLQMEKVIDISYASILQQRIKVEPSQQLFYSVKVEEQNNNQNYYHKHKGQPSKVDLNKFVQKQGRNCNSNILRSFFRLLNSIADERALLIQEIVKKRGLSLKVHEFCDWIDNLNIDVNKYIKISSVRHLFHNKDQYKEQSLILRILLNDFLKKEAIPCFLTSKKAKRGIVSHTLVNIRYLMHTIKDRRKKIVKINQELRK